MLAWYTLPLPPFKRSSPQRLVSTLIYSAGKEEFREWAGQQEGRVWDPRGILPYMVVFMSFWTEKQGIDFAYFVLFMVREVLVGWGLVLVVS